MITIGFITCRPEPRFDWFFDSLARQLKKDDHVEIVLVDFLAYPQQRDDWQQRAASIQKAFTNTQWTWGPGHVSYRWLAPKPTVWAGPHRLTKDNWWHAADARNTVLCAAEGDWWAQVDDRCVLLPGWMEAVRDAIAGNYAICGPYEKRTGITVENGLIRHSGIVTGSDNRLQYIKDHYDLHHHLGNPYSCPGEWWYGCSTCVPLDWALAVNGYDETCDSSSGEDYIFGLMLQNNGFEIRFDTRLGIVEDRTPEFIGLTMHRKDKGHSPNDKSHALLAKLRGQRRALHPMDMTTVRRNFLEDGTWPAATWPVSDWYDGEPLATMKP